MSEPEKADGRPFGARFMSGLALALARAAAFVATSTLNEPRQGNGRALVWLIGSLAANVAIALIYFAVSVPVAKLFGAFGVFPSPFWPGAGIALFSVVLMGWTVAPGIFLGSALANGVLFAAAPESAFLISITNMLGPVIGGVLLRRTMPPRQPVFLLADVARLSLYGVLLHSAITAFGGTVAGVAFDGVGARWPAVFLGWMLSDSAGVMMIGVPALLWWIDRRAIERRLLPQMVGISLIALLLGSSRFLLPSELEPPLGIPVMVAMCISWAVVRFYPRDAMTLFALVLFLLVVGTVFDPAPLIDYAGSNVVGAAGLAIIFGMFNVLLIGSIMEERALAVRRVSQDIVTGLPNRATFLSEAARELGRAQNYNRPLSVVTFDIDGFRSVNSRHGSIVGDAVLNAIGGHARAWLRPLDVLARIGDDEFAIMMIETDQKGATALAEQLRITIASTPIEINGAVVEVTVSVGVTGRRSGDTIDSVLDRANASRHVAQQAGRNRVAAA